MKKDISAEKRKHMIRLAVVVAAIGTGALCRSLAEAPPGAGRPSGTEFRTGISSLPGNSASSSGDISVFLYPAASSGDAGHEASGLQNQLPGGKDRKKTAPKDRKPDIEALEKGLRPIEGSPGDMRDYLEDSERKRKIRIRKSLGEIQKKVKEWEQSIFEPTW